MRFIPSSSDERQAIVLAAVIVMQALTAMFFLSDVIADFAEGGGFADFATWPEAIAVIGMIAGLIFLLRELRRLVGRVSMLNRSVQAARGEMADVIETFFTEWQLTASERDVALMLLKGIDNETIARLRGTAAGTVRAQCAAIYAKAGVDGRSQLFSVFMEELLAA